ncbi:hypothetical protein FPQ18DRAFT_410140, partial [Pyronema domesticum]
STRTSIITITSSTSTIQATGFNYLLNHSAHSKQLFLLALPSPLPPPFQLSLTLPPSLPPSLPRRFLVAPPSTLCSSLAAERRTCVRLVPFGCGGMWAAWCLRAWQNSRPGVAAFGAGLPGRQLTSLPALCFAFLSVPAHAATSPLLQSFRAVPGRSSPVPERPPERPKRQKAKANQASQQAKCGTSFPIQRASILSSRLIGRAQKYRRRQARF